MDTGELKDVDGLVQQVSDLSDKLRLETQRGAQLLEGLKTRDRIGQAKGILMERFKVDEDRAFMMLIHASSLLNVRLYDVALELTRTGRIGTNADYG